MSEREEFVRLAQLDATNMTQLCERYGISRKTGYKWLDAYTEGGTAGLANRSKRPHHSPRRTASSVEEAILELAAAYPAWGARKIWKLLESSPLPRPAVSTIQAVLQRNGRVCMGAGKVQGPFKRFEHDSPNDLWQMDFKADVPYRGGKAQVLTVLDDHSRFNICLQACSNQRSESVQNALQRAFRKYGMPYRMTMDNGSPWGDSGLTKYTKLTVWMCKLGINATHSRPYHPQTQGKDERFHRTVDAELLQHRVFASQGHLQEEFDHWRETYNTIRPHEGIGLITPIERYRPSERSYPEVLPVVEYDVGDEVRVVDVKANISWKGLRLSIGKAFIGERVAIRRTFHEHTFEIYFATHLLRTFDFPKTK